MSAWDVVLAAVLAQLGGGLAFSALRAARFVAALDGSPAVLVRRTLRCRKVLDEESVTVVTASRVECAEAEVHDASGTCRVWLDHLLILAPVQTSTFTGEALAARHPDLLASVPGIEAGTVVEKVVVEEQVFPEGARCFLSGRAVPAAAGATDRPSHRARALELHGAPDRPLVISSWDQAERVRG